MGVWLEIVTLLIPGFNDGEDELKGLTDFLAGVSPDIPWHVTAFHKDYKMDDPDKHHAGRPAARGRDRQARRVCATYMPEICPAGSAILKTRAAISVVDTLIKRDGYFVRDYHVTGEGKCPACQTAIPGRWAAKFSGQIADRPFLPRRSSGLVTIPS